MFIYESAYAMSLVVVIETFASFKISRYGEVPLNQNVELQTAL